VYLRSLYLGQVWTIAAKDLRSEWRNREAINASLAFSITILVMFSFAFDPDNPEIKIDLLAAGLLWMVYSFAAALALNRTFARELQNDCLDALLAAPIPASALFLGKTLANFALLLAIELISLGAFSVLYNVKIAEHIWQLLLVIALGTWPMAAMGTFFSALTVNLRLRELMLPMLIYPALIPALLAAISLTGGLLHGTALSIDDGAMKILVSFDIIFTSLAVLCIDIVLVG
jgi:heme exporter protein B